MITPCQTAKGCTSTGLFGRVHDFWLSVSGSHNRSFGVLFRLFRNCNPYINEWNPCSRYRSHLSCPLICSVAVEFPCLNSLCSLDLLPQWLSVGPNPCVRDSYLKTLQNIRLMEQGTPSTDQLINCTYTFCGSFSYSRSPEKERGSLLSSI